MPATVRNVAREKLEEGQLSLGVGVRMTRSVEIAKAMADELQIAFDRCEIQGRRHP
jgi:hypothetical protein